MVQDISSRALRGEAATTRKAIATRLALLVPAILTLAALCAVRQDALWTPASLPDRPLVADWRQQASPVYATVALPPRYPYAKAIARVAARFGLPADLIAGIVYVESRFNPRAVSNKGAVGLMQLLPSTARPLARKLGLGRYDLMDPETNLLLGAYFLKDRLREYGGDILAALSYYNGGHRMIVSRGQYRNRTYIRSVLHHSRRYAPLARRLN